MKYEVMMIISACVSAFNVILLKLYLDIFLIEGKRRVAGWLLFFLGQMYINMNASERSFGSNLLCIIITVGLAGILGYEAPLRKRCIFSMMFAALWILEEMVMLLGSEILRRDDVIFIIVFIMLSKSVMLSLIMGIRIYMKRKGWRKEYYGENISMVLPFLAVMTLYYSFYKTAEHAGSENEKVFIWLLLGTAALIILNLSIYPTYIYKLEEARIKKNEAIYIKQIELYKRHRQLEEEETARLHTSRHDLKQKLIYIHELVQHEEKEKLLDLLTGMIGETGKREGLKGNTGNLVVDVLVNNLCMNAQSKGIRLNTKITIPGKLNIEDTDLCILQGNAFDNAVEALEYVEEENREMWLEMKYERGSFLLNIKNRYIGELELGEDGMLKSRKREGIHGIGLHSMKKVVSKYNGSMVAEGKNGIFTLKVILYEQL